MKVFVAVFVPLLIAYAASLQWVWDIWRMPESYYSHGPLLPLLAGFLVWRWRARWQQRAAEFDPRAWWLLAPGLLVHSVGAALTIDSLSAASLVLTVPGAVWLAAGRRRTLALWPILGLVPLALPMPLFASGVVAFELKEIAVRSGLALANAMGLDGVRAGAELFVPGRADPLLVEDPCGGLRSLLALVTLGYCFAFLLGERGWRRVGLLLLAVPLALGLNIVRIAFLCWSARWWGVEVASTTAHDVANATVWLIAIVALMGLDRWLRETRSP
jgi:exosortase